MTKKYSQLNIYLVLVLVGLYLVLLPALQYQANGIKDLYNTKRVLQIGLFFFLCILLLCSKTHTNKTAGLINSLHAKVKIGLLCVFILGLLSAFLSPHFEWALLEVSSISLLFVLTFYVASVLHFDTDFSIKAIQFIVILAVSLYLLKFFMGYILHIWGDYPLWGSERSKMGLTGFGSKRHFNHIQTWTLPILISMVWMERRKPYKILLLLISGVWGMLMVASAARGTFVGLSVSFVVVLIMLKEQKSEFFKSFLMVTVLSSLFYLLFYTLLVESTTESLVDRFAQNGAGGRIEEWLSLVPGILENPILGMGPMHYSSIELGNGWGHLHNWLLQFIYEWGIPVGMIALGITLYALYQFSLQVFSKDHDIENGKSSKFKVAVFWSVLASIIHASLSGNFVTPISQVWFILIVGMAITFHFTSRKQLLQIGHNKSIVVVLILVSVLGYGNWAFNHGFNPDNYTDSYIEYYDTTYFHPRFWQQGKNRI